MKHYTYHLCAAVFLLTQPAFAVGSPVAAPLWAMQAAVPPGTNNTSATQTVSPLGVVGVGVGGLVESQTAPAQPGAGPGGPIGADGRMPGIPAGIPLPGSPAERAAQPTETAPSNRITPAAVGTISPAKLPPRCEVALGIGRTKVASQGGEFTISAAMQPAFCATPGPVTTNWVRIVDAATLRFAADPNTTKSVRSSVITIGDANFFVEQDPPPQPGLAAAPGRLVFAIDKRGKTDKKRIAAWSENSGAKFTARGGHAWLSVAPGKLKNNHQQYEVTVAENAGLGPGTHDTFVELMPEGSSNSLRIPVVVEVVGRP